MHSYLVSVSHYWFGLGVFAVALVLFFSLTTLFGPAAPPESARDPSVQTVRQAHPRRSQGSPPQSWCWSHCQP